MLSIVIEVRAPGWTAQGIKEHLAMYLERYADTRVVSVTEVPERRVERPTGTGTGPRS